METIKSKCPECGGKVVVYTVGFHGWCCGCSRYHSEDGVHKRKMMVYNRGSRSSAIEEWGKLK